MTLVFNARDATGDIDGVFFPVQDMRKYIKEIAYKHNLKDDWLNDGCKGYITPQMGTEDLLILSNLKVFSVNAEGLLAMKLIAARPNTNDLSDSLFLMKSLDIQTEQRLFDIINKYTHPKTHTMSVKFFTIEAYTQYKQTQAYENERQSKAKTEMKQHKKKRSRDAR